MSIKLDHTIVFAKDHDKAAQEFSDVMGLAYGNIVGNGYEFSIVQVNAELSLYFMNKDEIHLEQHMAFRVDSSSFNGILSRLKEEKIAYGSSPFERENQKTNHDFAPQGLFWTNMDGCLFEIMTDAF